MRTRLGAHFGETHTFTAVFQGFSRTTSESNVACFQRVRLNGVEVADHVWVHRSKAMKRLGMEYGDIVEFEARVGRYSRGEPLRHVSEIEYDFMLEKIKDVRIMERRAERESA